MRSIVVLAALVISSASALAEKKDVGAMMGAGMNTCAEFAQAFRKEPKQAEVIHFMWAQGFMSGLNVLSISTKQPMRDLNAWQLSDQSAFLRQFCADNPLAEYATGVRKLFFALPAIRPQSN